MATSGMSLRLERIAARVTIVALADVIGRDRRTVARYEGLEVVPPEIAANYRKSLATFREVAESVAS